MGTPKVIIEQTSGNLGRVDASEDGVSAIVVSGPSVGGKFNTGEVLGPFRSLADAEDAGITAAYDTTNNILAHKHIADFYEGAGNGTELYVMVVPTTVTMEDICDKDLNYAAKILRDLQGKVRICIITRVPDGAYVPVYVEQFEEDLWDAILKLKDLRTFEFDRFRPVSFVIEGRNFQGTASSAKNLRDPLGLNANRVTVAMIQDYDYGQVHASYNKYAAAGLIGGLAAGTTVNRSIGRVRSGAIPIVNAGYSNGTDFNSLTDTNRDTLHDKGYVIPVTIVGKAGFYLNGDPVVTPISDDYNSIALGRVADKATRITRIIYGEDLNDDFPVDAAGKLPVSVAKNFQERVRTAILASMAGEISGVAAVVDPNQNIITSGELSVELDIQPRGTIGTIKVKQSFKVSLS